jgi:hypothetical protein
MKTRTPWIAGALGLGLLASTAMAANLTVHPQPYEYGMHLDIAKIISMTEPLTRECKVITAQMKYLDSAGNVQDISYLKLSEGCSYDS